jgi:hypothetical protein
MSPIALIAINSFRLNALADQMSLRKSKLISELVEVRSVGREWWIAMLGLLSLTCQAEDDAWDQFNHFACRRFRQKRPFHRNCNFTDSVAVVLLFDHEQHAQHLAHVGYGEGSIAQEGHALRWQVTGRSQP